MAATPPEYTEQSSRDGHLGRPDLGDGPRPLFDERMVGKLVVVTGGGGLLGAALADELGRRGADVALIGHDPADLDETVESLGSRTRALSLRCDLGSESDVGAAVEFLQRLDRPVDFLVHAAGLQEPSTIAWSSVKGLDEHYLWNIRGPYLLTQKLLPLLSARFGRVVFFVAPSAGADSGSGGDVHHRISNAGLESFANELRVEADNMGIHVLTVNARIGTWTQVSDAIAGPGGADLLKSFARAVTQAILSDAVDVTDVGLRVPSGTKRPHPS